MAARLGEPTKLADILVSRSLPQGESIRRRTLGACLERSRIGVAFLQAHGKSVQSSARTPRTPNSESFREQARPAKCGRTHFFSLRVRVFLELAQGAADFRARSLASPLGEVQRTKVRGSSLRREYWNQAFDTNASTISKGEATHACPRDLI